MIETEIYLINFENKLTEMPLEITWEIQEKVLFLEREGKCLQGLLGDLLKETKEAKLCRAFYKPEG